MSTDHEWLPGEHTRILACPNHAGAISRMDFDWAVDVAEDCDHCITIYRGAAI